MDICLVHMQISLVLLSLTKISGMVAINFLFITGNEDCVFVFEAIKLYYFTIKKSSQTARYEIEGLLNTIYNITEVKRIPTTIVILILCVVGIPLIMIKKPVKNIIPTTIIL